ncbi:Cyclin p1,1 isoform 2 [Theobroma cacao]|uniref:Cyclin p1,1 isoform 2 n=1 Tax=Theobroma cacao TaxID=3641 RepID=A0A061DPP5_THECC|nr:Cyclin p1,1 isoform 2 [Theobroma cacao]
MGTLAIDMEGVDSDIYLALGLKELGKRAIGTPRILSLLSSLLEKSVQKNEMQSETVDIKDSVAIFHGLRAPTISIQQYIDRIFKFFNNAYYARVGGISTAELNRLEMKFLFSLDFRLQVSVNTFQRYCSQLQKESSEGHQIERPIRACGIKESWSSKSDTQCAPTIAR